MTTAVQRRRGTTTEHASFTGLEGEISVNTTKDTLVVHDGSTAGGFELARADGSNFVATSVDINGGSIDGTTIGVSSASTGAFTTLTASGEITANGGIALGDNDKATFGDSDDLQIYHDGSGSYIDDAGTGNLFVRADNLQLRRADGSHLYLAANTGAEVALYHAGNSKLATTSTGIDVTGTATMDGLVVDGNISSTQGGTAALPKFTLSASTTTGLYTPATNSLGVTTSGVRRATFKDNGDIEAYEDTGTTAKLFWDASAESLGIGTAAPAYSLDSVKAGSNIIRVQNSASSADASFYATNTVGTGIFGINATGQYMYGLGNFPLLFYANGAERMRIDSAGNMLLNTLNSPTTTKAIISADYSAAGTTNTGLTITGRQGGNWYNNGIHALGASGLVFSTGTTGVNGADATNERMRIDSAGNVGIGTSSPLAKLQIKTQANANAAFQNSTSVAGGLKINAFNDAGSASVPFELDGSTLQFNIASVERMRIDSAGNVGLGTVTTGSYRFNALRLDGNTAFFTDGTTADLFIKCTGGVSTISPTTGILALGTSSSERMRIDSSGNLLVGKTSSSFATAGTTILPSGNVTFTRSGAGVIDVNRLSNDGSLINLYKDGTTVGSIGVEGSDLTIGTGTNCGIQFNDGNGAIRPFNMAGNNSVDNAVSLGISTKRFKDLYLSGGVYLGGTGAANKLDDYEEGTTSMTWSDGTNHSGAVVGKYTKVGRIVTVEGNVGGSLSGLTQTNDILISGFPFAFNAKGSFSLLTRYLNAPDNTNSVIGYYDSSGSTAVVFFVVDNGTYVTAKVQDFNQNTNDTYFSLTYTTA